MMPILFRLPFFHTAIYSYGLMMVIGFLSGIQIAKYLAKRCGIDPEIFVNVGLIALVAGVLGARASHVLENLPQYTNPARTPWENIWDAINIRSGGLTYYGGFLLAFPALVIYAIKKKVPIRLGMDIIAPALMLGLGFGRIGCFLNGCCYGATCNVPWAVSYPYDSIPYVEQYEQGQLAAPPALRDENDRLVKESALKAQPTLAEIARRERSLPVHPSQLYSTLTAWLICAMLLAYWTIPHVTGRVFALMLIVEGITRFLLELLRVEPPVAHIAGYGLSLSMILGIGFVALGVVLWICFGVGEDESAKARALPAAT